MLCEFLIDMIAYEKLLTGFRYTDGELIYKI